MSIKAPGDDLVLLKGVEPLPEGVGPGCWICVDTYGARGIGVYSPPDIHQMANHYAMVTCGRVVRTLSPIGNTSSSLSQAAESFADKHDFTLISRGPYAFELAA
jgi:hypothetical protein